MHRVLKRYTPPCSPGRPVRRGRAGIPHPGLSLGHPQTSARTAAARQPELPGETAQLVYASLVVAQLVLARRFRRDLRWRRWHPWLLAGAAATGVILIAYTAAVTGPAAAIL